MRYSLAVIPDKHSFLHNLPEEEKNGYVLVDILTKIEYNLYTFVGDGTLVKGNESYIVIL